ncbi:hypothetical protein [Candidatus Thiosymbion oneisti]|uniref:hypothetical protein n=1 Tax=Candidatus Thiosymbion oneisti TaxID=589554 RepID=UPI00105F293C|nr:hypothetical protein [Candidatus Thiosymbion oneisti]
MATQGEDTPGLYKGCSELRATQTGQVFWEPGRERILDGDCVRTFIDRGTRIEVERFFGGRIPGLDTLILSGCTSLWPGFGERLRTTLGTIANWVDFGSDANQLKQAVVLGVIEREFRWRHIGIETPQTIGDFGVRYEPRAGDWKFAPYARSGERKSFDLQNAGEVQIGLRTNNGFHLCYSLLPDLYYAEDTKLTIQLDYDETGYLEAEVTNSDGNSTRINQLTNIPTLAYERRPWPLGTARLHEMTPEELMGDEGETA